MHKIVFATILLSTLFLSSCIPSGDGVVMNPPETVKYVDLNRYVGEWFEIARYENRFQKRCTGSRATYSLRSDGKIDVLNQCFDKSEKGEPRSAKGKAWVVDKQSNAKLKVSFFWPFAGDYWIIDLGDSYEYAVIGHPKRKYLWILSRTPQMDQKLFEKIVSRLEKQGYDKNRLKLSSQFKG